MFILYSSFEECSIKKSRTVGVSESVELLKNKAEKDSKIQNANWCKDEINGKMYYYLTIETMYSTVSYSICPIDHIVDTLA